MNYFTRTAELTDLDDIETILQDARLFLHAQGLQQWQNRYGPGRTEAERDIGIREGYVFVVDGAISGYAALISGVDEAYTQIYDGYWNNRYNSYLSIHRVALSSALRGKGCAHLFFDGLLQAARQLQYHDIRIDTHPQNKIMQKVILREGFHYAGMIVFPIPDGERKAYQLLTM